MEFQEYWDKRIPELEKAGFPSFLMNTLFEEAQKAWEASKGKPVYWVVEQYWSGDEYEQPTERKVGNFPYNSWIEAQRVANAINSYVREKDQNKNFYVRKEYLHGITD